MNSIICFSSCQFETFLIQIGTFSQKLSGLTNQMVNIGFRILSDDYTYFDAACNNYDGTTDAYDYIADGVTTEISCGKELAKIVKKFINSQTSVASNNEYNKVLTDSTTSSI
jgi:hypothetical protein